MISGEKSVTKTSRRYLWIGNTGKGVKQDPFFLNHFSLHIYERAARFNSFERL